MEMTDEMYSMYHSLVAKEAHRLKKAEGVSLSDGYAIAMANVADAAGVQKEEFAEAYSKKLGEITWRNRTRKSDRLVTAKSAGNQLLKVELLPEDENPFIEDDYYSEIEARLRHQKVGQWAKIEARDNEGAKLFSRIARNVANRLKWRGVQVRIKDSTVFVKRG